MKFQKNIMYLLVASLLIMQSCLKDDVTIFDETAAARAQKAVETYHDLLISAENGWYINYYPEVDYAVGGYAMYWKFTGDGQVKVQCETVTNNPPNTPDISEFDVFAEQGVILSFSSYNKVLHYFCESTASDYNGQEGDYEFIIMSAGPDQILLKGKKHGNKMTLRRNVDNLDPDTYLAEVAALANQAADAFVFHLIVNNDTLGRAVVAKRTLVIEYAGSTDLETPVIPYAFTGDGIKLQTPIVVNDVTIENLRWDPDQLQYVCTDPGVNAYLAAFFPSDYQLRYSEFLGKWKLSYKGRNSSAWASTAAVDTVEVIMMVQNESFRMKCDKLFNPDGLILSFDPQKGNISLYCFSVGIDDGWDLRQVMYAVTDGYSYSTVNSSLYGMLGVWNNDTGGERIITFQDNGKWQYKAEGIILRSFDGSTNRNYYGKAGFYAFRDLVLTKING
jgi:hypothetical protein